jgi:flagellin-like hook-associated protein FlgL
MSESNPSRSSAGLKAGPETILLARVVRPGQIHEAQVQFLNPLGGITHVRPASNFEARLWRLLGTYASRADSADALLEENADLRKQVRELRKNLGAKQNELERALARVGHLMDVMDAGRG